MTPRKALAKKVRGYPKLAGQIGLRPELAIFRRFGALSSENLLYLQAELVLLERKLEEQQKVDNESDHERKTKYALNWYQLKHSAEHGDTVQLDLVLRIRKVLKQYSMRTHIRSRRTLLTTKLDDALVRQAQILSFSKPDRKDLTFLQNYLHADLGLSLCGPDATLWGSFHRRQDHSPDLVTLCPRTAEDPFSNWAVDRTITYLFKFGCARFMKASPIHGVIGYEETTVFQVTYWITSIVASLIPISSIAVLYKVHSMPARLAIIAGFNVLISICLCGLTSAKRSEIFAVASALVSTNPFQMMR
ncbi:hypothetical protein P171DRAFT_497717 [Karstenula rhodostoma CBS 690.94]|uniref:DUF6594 domain-containing protein n=1 Tax=Karstenula rhodostoma CBS 690.94 TaxID=1392251 RepID=A0A9P4U913_9PLEO|nr:hypothetical protein P171DRAFT_497717 [Karstenula rhodostoma CBS 690.94]